MMLVQHIVPNQWNFLSTRNNNFSNRSQKGSLFLPGNASPTYTINSNGYSSFDDSPQAGNAQIVIEYVMIDDSHTLQHRYYLR